MKEALLVLLCASVQDEGKLHDELQETLRALRQERAEAYSRRRARTAEIESARAPLRRLEVEIAELKAREGEADKNLMEVEADLAKLRREEQANAAHAAALAPALKAAVADAVRFVETGPAYRKADRLLRLGADAPDVGRAWTFLQEELRIARSGEAYTAEIPLPGGRLKPARIFRVGHLLQGFVTEDGLEAGIETPAGWTPAASPAQEKAVREAVEILDRRRPPALLLFPVQVR